MILLILPSLPISERLPSYKGIFFVEHIQLLLKTRQSLFVIVIDVQPALSLYLFRAPLFSLRYISGLPYTLFRITFSNPIPRSYVAIDIFIGLLAFIIALFLGHKINSIVSHYLIYPGILGSRVSRAISKPLALFSHRRTDLDLIPKWEASQIQDAVQCASKLFSPSKTHSDFLRSYFPNADIVVFPNPISPLYIISRAELSTIQSKRCERVNSGLATILCIGNLIPLKNPHVVLDGFHRFILQETNRKVRLVFVGEGHLFQLLKDRSISYGLSECVLFRKYSFNDIHDLRELIVDSELFISASNRETFGLSILESLSLGVPAIVSNSGGPSDFFSAPYGIQLKYTTAESIANSIHAILSNYSFYSQNMLHFPSRLYSSDYLAPSIADKLNL